MGFYNVKATIENNLMFDTKNIVVICDSPERAIELVKKKTVGLNVTLSSTTVSLCDHVPLSVLGVLDSVLYDDEAIYPMK